jgi:hypothetical protein
MLVSDEAGPKKKRRRRRGGKKKPDSPGMLPDSQGPIEE